MDAAFWQLVTLRHRLCSFSLPLSDRLMRCVMVYTLTCTVEAFCTFLARNRYNCQAVCRTAAAGWVQTGDTQLYVHLTECKHRHYYVSPVRTESAERGESCPGNGLNCLSGSVFTLLGEGKLLNVRTSLFHHAANWNDNSYLLPLFSPFPVASFALNIPRCDDHSGRRARAVVW